MITFIDIAGTFVFALSGVMLGIEKKYDLFGVFILAFVTALGGGTLRDILLGETPVGWMLNPYYMGIVALAVFTSYFFSKYFSKLKKGLFLFDTLGIGLFTVLGTQKSLEIGLSPIISIGMGIVTAVFGGIIRDILANRSPLIFSKEIYASACLAGASSYIILKNILPFDFAIGFSIAVVIIIRILAIKRKWHLSFTPK